MHEIINHLKLNIVFPQKNKTVDKKGKHRRQQKSAQLLHLTVSFLEFNHNKTQAQGS